MFAVWRASAMSATSARTRGVSAPSSSPIMNVGPVAAQDPPGRDDVGAEVHERADHALAPDRRGDRVLVEAVLERDDEPVGREQRRHPLHRGRRVVRLHRQQHGAEPVGQVVRRHRARRHGELLDRALDAQAVRVDGGDVLGVGVAQEHLVAVTDEPSGNRAADRPRPDDGIAHCPILPRARRPDHAFTIWTSSPRRGILAPPVSKERRMKKIATPAAVLIVCVVALAAGCGGSSGGSSSGSSSGGSARRAAARRQHHRRLVGGAAVDGQGERLRQRVDLGARADHGAALHRQPRRQEREAVARDVLHPLARQDDVHVPPAPGREVLERQADDVGRRQVLDRADPEHGLAGLGLPRLGDQGHQDAQPGRPSSSTRSTRGRRSWPTSRCSRTASSRTTTAARRPSSSTPTRSAPARSCGTTGRTARRSSS